MNTHFKPVKDRIIVKVDSTHNDHTHVTSGGIYIPQDTEEKVLQGVIQSLGQDVDVDVKVQDKVLFSKYSAVALGNNYPDLFSLKQEDILCVIA